MNPIPPTKVALYCRVNTPEQVRIYPVRCIIYARSASVDELDPQLDGQVDQCMEFIALKAQDGWHVTSVIKEPGVSGLKFPRPGMSKVLSAIRRRTADVVVVTKRDRLSRSIAHLTKIQNYIEAHGGQVASCYDPSNPSNRDSVCGRLVRALLAGVEEFESAELRQRIKAAVIKRAKLSRPQQKGRAAS